MKIIRVFPKKTSHTPSDKYSFVGRPPMVAFIPDHQEVHISVTFTWDIKAGFFLKKRWEKITKKPVLIGGPALDDRAGDFTVGKYLKKGIVITSRGCPNKCGFCLVPKREGTTRELEIKEGDTIQDNNFLACSDKHKADVFNMLQTKKQIRFTGGFEARRIDLSLITELKKLKISEMWLACDHPKSLRMASKKIELLRSEGFTQHNVRCYVLIGIDKKEETKRLQKLLEAGCSPFALLFQPSKTKRKVYSKEWKDFQRFWSRPAIYKSKNVPKISKRVPLLK